MPRTVSVPILSTHAIAEKVRLYSDFRVYQFFLFNPARFFFTPPPFFAMLPPRDRSPQVRVIRIDMSAYTCLHIKKKIPVRMNAQRNALEMEKKKTSL